jgi:hypothetical protein
LRWWLSLFAGASILYAATANRGPQWQDSGQHILRAVSGETVNPLGLALTHPLHHWLAKLVAQVDWLEPCHAITLISAVAAAVAIANVFGCVWTLTTDRRAALLAAVGLCLAHTFWQMATRAETYTITAALLSAECWCVAAYARGHRPRHLLGAMLINGVGLANHNLALLSLPVLIGLFAYSLWRRQVRPRHALLAAGLWLAGSLPYTGLVVVEWSQTGDLAATLHSALFGHAFADEVLNASVQPTLLGMSAGFVALNFPNLMLPAAIVGLVWAGKLGTPAEATRALIAALLMHAVFAARYPIQDQYMFFVPTYVYLCLFGGVGYAAIRRLDSARARRTLFAAAVVLLAATPATYAVTADIARRHEVLGSLARNKPYRDDYVYALIPWTVSERSAERFSRQAVDLASPDGLIIVEDAMARFAVEYRALRSPKPHPTVVASHNADAIREAALARTPVVLVPEDRDNPTTPPPHGLWRRTGDLYVLDHPADPLEH